MKVLVTGSGGQLGRCIQDRVKMSHDENYIYLFCSRQMLDVTDYEQVKQVFDSFKPDIVINCAAYTDVDGAENLDNAPAAAILNSDVPRILVEQCRRYKSVLIHFSTDYVFDGKAHTPYTENEPTEVYFPSTRYGKSKLLGEFPVLSYKRGIVIRTSWLYSEYGKNIYRTFLDRIKTERHIFALSNRLSCPTYARDLADFVIGTFIENQKAWQESSYGTFNYCNEGVASIYDFAAAIEALHDSYALNYEPMRKDPMTFEFKLRKDSLVAPVKEYEEKAQRPNFSALDCSKVRNVFGVAPRSWIAALINCMQNDKAIKLR